MFELFDLSLTSYNMKITLFGISKEYKEINLKKNGKQIINLEEDYNNKFEKRIFMSKWVNGYMLVS